MTSKLLSCLNLKVLHTKQQTPQVPGLESGCLFRVHSDKMKTVSQQPRSCVLVSLIHRRSISASQLTRNPCPKLTSTPKVLMQEAWEGPRSLHSEAVLGSDADDLHTLRWE